MARNLAYERFAKSFLAGNLDVFVWKHAKMVDIYPKEACIDQKIKHKMQRRRPTSAKKYEALKKEVNRLLENGVIQEA